MTFLYRKRHSDPMCTANGTGTLQICMLDVCLLREHDRGNPRTKDLGTPWDVLVQSEMTLAVGIRRGIGLESTRVWHQIARPREGKGEGQGEV